jgi:alpha-D-xyloside xylohydrolase
MFLEVPEDEKCWESRDQYFCGGSILVAPVCRKGAKSREVYLPAGCDWINAFTGQQYQGGSTIEEAAPLDAIPVYYRADRKRPTEGWLA